MLRAVMLAALLLCTGAVAQNQNTANSYREAFTALGFPPFGTHEAGLLSPQDVEFIGNLGVALSEGDRMRLDTIMHKAGPALAQIVEATRARQCDWGIDRAQGFSITLPHLAAMRSTARTLRARALLATADADRAAAVEALGAFGRMAAHAGQDTITISSFVGSALGSYFTSTATFAIESGMIDQSNAQAMMDEVAVLKRPDPFGYADAMRGEYAMMAAEFSARPAEEVMAALAGRELSEQERATLASPARMQGMLRQAQGMCERAATAMENPDPVAARRELKDIEASMEGGRNSAFLKLLMPEFTQIYEVKLRSDQDLVVFFARLQALAEGKASEVALLNAAPLLQRAAAAAAGAGADAQEAYELVRVSPGALDALALERAAAQLERARPRVMDLLAKAATLTRCDFTVLRLPDPSLNASLLGGLRAATRMTLADGLHRARAAKDPALAAPAIALVYRVAALVTRDPSLARAHVTQSIWNEANAALQGALAIGPMPAAATADIELALGAMPPQDPFGWRAGFEADVKRLVEHTTRQQSGAMTPELSEMRARIFRQRGPTATLARVAMITASRGADDALPRDDAPQLERLTDLWPMRAAEAATRAAEAARAADEADGRSRVDVSMFDVELDLPLEEQRSTLRRNDPVRGVVFIDVPAAQSESTAVYMRPFEMLTKRDEREAQPPAPPAQAGEPSSTH